MMPATAWLWFGADLQPLLGVQIQKVLTPMGVARGQSAGGAAGTRTHVHAGQAAVRSVNKGGGGAGGCFCVQNTARGVTRDATGLPGKEL